MYAVSYHMKKYFKSYFGGKMSRICHICTTLLWASFHKVTKISNSQFVD